MIDVPEWFAIVVATLLGLIFGSFATVAWSRIPEHESIVSGRSHCPHCGRTITWFENIPLLSYILLRGRCRGCGAAISIKYPLTEAATGALFALSAWKFGLSVTGLVFAAFFWVLVVLTAIDLEHKLLPNRIVYPAFIAGWVGLVCAAASVHDLGRLVDALIGAAIFGGFLFIVAFIYPPGMGLGDVKLAFLLGSFLGYVGGVGVVLTGMFLSFLIGGLSGIVVAAVTRGGRKMKIPFGPFLAAGTIVAVFAGQHLVDAYLSSF